MEFNKLGNSGLSISPLIVGCMSYGSKSWGDWVIDDEEKVFSLLKKAYDSGLRTFDTADVYSNGKSEVLLGKFIKKFSIPRDKITIFTKLYNPIDPTDPHFKFNELSKYPSYEYANSRGLSRKHIWDAIEGSVERLGTFVDVLQIHRLDRETPKAEIMKALNDVVEKGLARYIGASSMKAVEFAQLQFIAEKNNWSKFISMQNYYNLLYREEEREMIPFCNNNELGKVGLIPWSPIARGILARPLKAHSKFNRSPSTDKTMFRLGLNELSKEDQEIIKRVEALSKKHKVSMAVISCTWVRSKGATPIIGFNTDERIDELVNSLSFQLSDEEIRYIEKPYRAKFEIQN